jgi:flagellar motor switch protein FliN
MSEAAAIPSQDLTRLIQLWAEVMSQVLGEISGSSLPCTLLSKAPAELASAGDTDLWVLVTSSGTLRGEMAFRLPTASTVRLAQIFMSEPAAAAEITSEHREATLELLRQVGGLVATAIKSTWGDVQLHLDISPTAPSWPASSAFWLRIGDDSSTLIEAQISAALVASLRTEKADAAQPTTEAAVATPAAPVAPSASSPALDEKVNLSLLMDVELAVTLRFGSRRLPLREVLDLNPGSIIELNRRVQEPVDMLLDGRIVARGEVVVVEGNYGLRVTEVAPAGS